MTTHRNIQMDAETFQHKLLAWFDQCGRKDLPWQKNITPYRIWLSEIMLQQTQVVTVIPYFENFTKKFPSVESLAQAPIDDVLNLWSGLGYYARARNLHKSAQIIAEQGFFPETLEELTALPGIGLSTAGAILSIAFNKSQPILDGNVKRVLTRFNAISGWPGDSAVNKILWAISTNFTPQQRVADYTQAIMDLGATLCTRNKPCCEACPVNKNCKAKLTNTVALLPTPKASKKIPVKQLVLLLLQNTQGQVLLEKRPPLGIWGGLWSVPEFSDLKAVQDWCLTHNINTLNQHELPTKRHTFSHYHLDYTPVMIQTDAIDNWVMGSDEKLWCTAGHMKSLGLATPIKRLLQQYFKQQG
jgi:A/G-specific adenine glycosylase